jgi:hypothetical protein
VRDAIAIILVLCIVGLVHFVNRRLLAGSSILGGRIQPKGSTRFPIVATKDTESERKQPVTWLWVLIDLFVLIGLIWYFNSVRR